VVLAAGSGTRFGGPKPVAELDGRPLVLHAVEAARTAEIDHVIVVVGHEAEVVATAVADHLDVEVVVNPDHAQGQATSVRAGLTAAQAHEAASVAVILLADQPRVDPTVIRQVVTALEDGADVARAAYDDRPGHPVAFPRRVWPRLIDELTGDEGARQLLSQLEVAHVLVPGAMPADIDHPADLARLEGQEPDARRPEDRGPDPAN
jgi:CTP:molybdopterin cytidylyltransferase MocA